MRVGDAVVAIGNPFGLERTVTAGIVSALQREITAPNGSNDRPRDPDRRADQPRQLGGPLLNSSGEVDRRQRADLDPNGGGNVGIGFAVPTNTIKTVVAQMIRQGRSSAPYLGITGTRDRGPTRASLPAARSTARRAGRGRRGRAARPKAPAISGGTTSSRHGRRQSYVLGGDMIVAVDGEPSRDLGGCGPLVA